MKISNRWQEILSFFDLVASGNRLIPKFESSSSFQMKFDVFPYKPLKTTFPVDSSPSFTSFQMIGWLLWVHIAKEIVFFFSLNLPTLKMENFSSFSLKLYCFSDKQKKTIFPPNTPTVFVFFYTIGGLLHLWVTFILLPR